MRIVTFRIGAIGDSLITFPILRALRAKYTNAHITFVSHPAILPLVQAWGLAEEVYDQSQFQWNELYAEEGIRSPNWLHLLQQADLAVSLLRNGADPLKQNLLAAGAKEAIAAHEYQHPIPIKHVVEYLAESIGLLNIMADSISPIIARENAFCLYTPPIAVHPGSSEPGRRWPAASFAAVINRLLLLRQPVLLLAGPLDTQQLREVRRHLSTPPQPGMLTILRNSPLLELARQISQCKCYLGNDSGITHLAALLGIPTIALIHPQYVIHMHPLGPSVELIPEERLERLSVERVFESIQRHI